jgi:aryl-alcohol dehydrogenase-like predicted oxidoreductase
MDYVRFGTAGLTVSRLAFGCSIFGSKDWVPWALSEEEAQPHYRKAFQSGYTLFDTADAYSHGQAEEILGRAVKRFGTGRDRVVIATKLFEPMGPDPNQRGLSRKHIRHAIDDSLRRLGTDYVDLYQIHRLDTATPMEELLEGLNDVVRAGKVLYLGASSMHAWQFAKLQYTARLNGLTPFVSMQNRYNLLYREEEREMLPFCQDQGVAVMVYSPLQRGLLAGSRRHGTMRSQVVKDFDRPNDEAIIDNVMALAAARGVKPAQIALAWLLRHPAVTCPIIGATRPEQLEDAVEALGITLSDAEMDLLEAPYLPQQVRFLKDLPPTAGHTASPEIQQAMRKQV